MKKNILLLIGLLVSMLVFSQNSSKPFQLTFAYPLGTNGMNSSDITNNVSFNMIYGYNNALQGFEAGSVLNINKSFVSGFQIAGVSNITLGKSEGIIASGVCNYAKGDSQGISISGVANVNSGSHKGIQMSTINVVKDTLKGAQMGIVNKAGIVKGFQIGIVNIAKNTDKGISIGLINIVKENMYSSISLRYNTNRFANLVYKLGTHRLYTLYSVGIASYNKENVLSNELGLGTRVFNNDKLSLFVETSVGNIRKGFKSGGSKNVFSKLSVSLDLKIYKNISFTTGLDLNGYYTKGTDNNLFYIPSLSKERKFSNSSIYSWIGANCGISINI
ncbi:MAG: hypothetical protein WBG43_01065 [Marinifilaceae bacterium]